MMKKALPLILVLIGAALLIGAIVLLIDSINSLFDWIALILGLGASIKGWMDLLKPDKATSSIGQISVGASNIQVASGEHGRNIQTQTYIENQVIHQSSEESKIHKPLSREPSFQQELLAEKGLAELNKQKLQLHIPIYLRLERESSELIKSLLEVPEFRFYAEENSKYVFNKQMGDFYERLSLIIGNAENSVLSQQEINQELDYHHALGTEILGSGIPQNIRDALREILSTQKRSVDLRIVTSDSYLESLPWELVSDPYVTNSSNLKSFSITRFVDGAHVNEEDCIANSSNLRLMLAGSQPIAKNSPNIGAEFMEITQQFEKRRQPVEIHQFDHIEYFDFVKNLQEINPTVLHIALHGTPDGVYFQRHEASQIIPYSSLLMDIKQAQNLLLVILNVCYSAHSAQPDTSPNFARSLVQAGVPAVVGMATQFTNRASIEFNKRLYAELSAGRSALQGFDRAIDTIRNLPGYDRLLWGVPIFYHFTNVIPFPIPLVIQTPKTSLPKKLDKKLSVFLCHSSQDKPVVRELYTKLLSENWVDPWLDEKKLLPGQDWDLEIEEAVEKSDAVIVFLSANSIEKEGYIQKELRFVLDIALEKPDETIFIVPLRLDSIQPPRRLRRYHYVDYFPKSVKDSAYQSVLASLKHRAKKIGIELFGEL